MIIKYLKELFNRFMLISFCWSSAFIVMYYYKEIILFEIITPSLSYTTFDSNYFIFTNITELFTVYFNLLFFLSSQILIIFSFYNLFIFVSPGLYLYEYNNFKIFLQSFFFSYLISNFFLICVLVPFLWNFFLGFQSKLTSYSLFVYFEAKVSEYISFFIEIYYLSMVQFQILVILILFFIYYPINRVFIKKFKKLFYFSFLLLATVATPPDLASQLGVFLFLIFVFELTVLVSIFFNFFKNCKY